MVIDYLFRVVHAAVTDLDGVSVEDFSELALSKRSLFRRKACNPMFANVCLG